MYAHACLHVCMHAYMHTDDRGFSLNSRLNFAFFTENDKMWDLPCDCQRQITGGLVFGMGAGNNEHSLFRTYGR